MKDVRDEYINQDSDDENRGAEGAVEVVDAIESELAGSVRKLECVVGLLGESNDIPHDNVDGHDMEDAIVPT